MIHARKQKTTMLMGDMKQISRQTVTIRAYDKLPVQTTLALVAHDRVS